MIKVKNLVPPSAEQFEVVINGMRNAFKSYDRADSFVEELEPEEFENCYYCDLYNKKPQFIFGENDKKLANNLIGGDSPSHRKFLRQLPLVMDIIAPLYFWKQLDTYKVGTTANSESTMHTITKYPFEEEDFSFDYINEAKTGETDNGLDWENKVAIDTTEILINNLNFLRDQAIQNNKAAWHMINELLPQSYLQKRTWTANYEVVLTIMAQRIHHKLPEWRNLIVYWLENIPHLLDFAIAGGVVKVKGSNIVINDSTEEFLFSSDEIES